MTSILAQFKVQEYSKWRAVFDENTSARAAEGMGAAKVFRDSNDGNSVALLLEVTDLDKARAYADSDALKQAQMKGGVIPPPTMTWLDDA
ncbi:MAG: hypothetical protein V3U49_03960 [Nitrososphaerales archaeon]